MVLSNSIHAQTESYEKPNSWYFLYTRQFYTPKWSSSIEIHERTQLPNLEHKNFLFRPSVDYHLFQKTEVSFGYTFINTYLNNCLNSYENNIWEQIFHNFEIENVKGYQRFRLENRWMQQYITSRDSQGNQEYNPSVSHQYSNRFRYRIGGTIPIGSSKAWFGNVFDELWINANPHLQFTSLARNWVYLGIGYHWSSSKNIQLGYLHQRDFKTVYENTNVIQLSYTYNLHFESSKP